MTVKLYVEGGGEHNKALQTSCRRGFSEFVRKAGLGGRMPRIIACGGRQRAFESFRTAHGDAESATAMLLVDSEGPVVKQDPWTHVGGRVGDGWERPAGASANQLHLMVEAMESWFHADKDALREYFGREFRADALSGRSNIETIPKADLFDGLRRATRKYPAGEYSKGAHSFPILERIDPKKVAGASGWARRFLDTLSELSEPMRDRPGAGRPRT